MNALKRVENGDALRVNLLLQGVYVYATGYGRTNNRVTACNGIMLEYVLEEKLYGVKVRPNPDSNYLVIERDRDLQLLTRDGDVLTTDVTIVQSKFQSPIFTEQLSGIVAASLYGCTLVNTKEECQFCSAQAYTGPKFTVDYFSSELRRIQTMQGIDALTLSAGSLVDKRYKGYEQMGAYIRAARDLGVYEINIELMPSPQLDDDEVRRLMQVMNADGVTSAQFNIEIWNPEKRKELMPYKGGIPVETYLRYFALGSDIFGPGKTSSVILSGLNTCDELFEAAVAIIGAGGIPSLEVFRPLPNTRLENTIPSLEMENVLQLSSLIKQMLDAKYGDTLSLEGCLKCGGCSVKRLNSEFQV